MKIKTVNLYFAAYVIAKGGKLEGTEETDTKKRRFVIESDLEFENLKKEFWQNKEIPVKDFVAALLEIKDIMYNFE